MAASDVILRAEGLTKVFSVKGKEDTVALDGLDFRVPAGQLTALVGPDGAGKTTLMRLICGLMTRTQGRLFVAGRDVTV